MKIDFSGSENDTFADAIIRLPAYPLDEAVTWIQDHLEPWQVFTHDQLSEWAKNNGFVEEE